MEQEFLDFLMTVPADEQPTVLEIDKLMKENQYDCDIKNAKSGYVVSYVKKINKKKVTIANFVFRKKNVKIRIYAANVAKYEQLLDQFPQNVKEEIAKAGNCKRLFDPNDCNQRCPMGYDFFIDGTEYKKCRYMAFMPTLCPENDKTIIEFLSNEIREQNA